MFWIKNNCYLLIGILKGRDSSGGIATDYELEAGVRFPAGARFVSFP
jgi:hypothetical protein